jgi:hypothetical protein
VCGKRGVVEIDDRTREIKGDWAYSGKMKLNCRAVESHFMDMVGPFGSSWWVYPFNTKSPLGHTKTGSGPPQTVML